MIGAKYGKLTVLEITEKTIRGYKCLCLCECGGKAIVLKTYLVSGHTKSCGCIVRNQTKTHGMSKTHQYSVYVAMIDRCHNKNNRNYHHYGGRGIEVCDEWRKGFQSFWDDMGESFVSGLTLDRTDNNKGYSKENCRWITQKEQKRNTRQNVFIEFNGEVKTISQWAETLGIDGSVISKRRKRGWTDYQALTRPVTRKGKRIIKPLEVKVTK